MLVPGAKKPYTAATQRAQLSMDTFLTGNPTCRSLHTVLLKSDGQLV